jgi:hypothetical protein
LLCCNDSSTLFNKSHRSLCIYQVSEAEYFALREAAKDFCFIVMVLEAVGLSIQTPIVVMVENVGAIFMTENVSAISRAKHIDTWNHFVHEFVEVGMIKIVFVKTQDSKVDMFTKKVGDEVYDEHCDGFSMDCKDITPHGCTTWEGVRMYWPTVVLYDAMCATNLPKEVLPKYTFMTECVTKLPIGYVRISFKDVLVVGINISKIIS